MTDTIRDLLISLASHVAYMQGQLETHHELDDLEDFYWYRESVALRQKVADYLAAEPAVSEGGEPTRDELWGLWLRLDQEIPDRPAAVAEFWEHARVHTLSRWSNRQGLPDGSPLADGEVADALAAEPAVPEGREPGAADLEEEFRSDGVHPFVVRHYADDERPSIKGNGFDGLEVGEDRQEAEEFIAWINKLIRIASQPRTTDEDWDALVNRLWSKYETIGYQGERFMYEGDFCTALDLVRQEIARWGNPAPAPPVTPISDDANV